MKRIILCFYLMVCMLCLLLPGVCAATGGACSDNISWVLDDSGVLVISGTGEMPDYDFETSSPWHESRNLIKSVVIESGVTSIGSRALFSCGSLTDVSIPSTVTKIAGSAFYDCKNLSEVSIPDSVTTIENYAFCRCTDLSNIIIPGSVSFIGHSVFSHCDSLEGIEVDSGNQNYASVDGVLFSIDKTNLTAYPSGSKQTSYDIPGTVTDITRNAFSGCTDLAAVTIPGSVEVIGDHSFEACTSLKTVTISDGVGDIGNYAFSACTLLTRAEIPESVENIGESAFSGCSRLTDISIPGSVVTIGKFSFSNCGALDTVSIPEGVESIGNSAFYGCGALQDISIPGSVTYIGSEVFCYCTELTEINVNENNEYYASEDGILFNKDKTYLLCCPGGKKGTYLIPYGVTNVEDFAFYFCTGIANIGVPDSVTSIGISVFYGCNGLILFGDPGSYAQTYARNKNITFMAQAYTVSRIERETDRYKFSIDILNGAYEDKKVFVAIYDENNLLLDIRRLSFTENWTEIYVPCYEGAYMAKIMLRSETENMKAISKAETVLLP